MKKANGAMPLYLGDNGVHKFWESTNREAIILQNHSEPFWCIFINEVIWDHSHSLRKARIKAQKKIGRRLIFDTSHNWILAKPTDKKMILVKGGEE
jgi:hypothetical protein